MSIDEIKPVRRVYKDGGDYMARCPHCDAWLILEGDDLSELRGGQYHHSSLRHGCDGWLQVETLARFAGSLPE